MFSQTRTGKNIALLMVNPCIYSPAIINALERALSPEAFWAALQEKGYTLARGDRRDYVILDRKGGIHSLARRIDGMKALALRGFMAPIDRSSVPDNEAAREIIAERERRLRDVAEKHNEAILEAGYSRSDDYVTQSHAAMRDHHRRLRIRSLTDSPRGSK